MLDPIVTALKDDDDDVRAVAASALLPVAESLVTFAPNHVSYCTCRAVNHESSEGSADVAPPFGWYPEGSCI